MVKASKKSWELVLSWNSWVQSKQPKKATIWLLYALLHSAQANKKTANAPPPSVTSHTWSSSLPVIADSLHPIPPNPPTVHPCSSPTAQRMPTATSTPAPCPPTARLVAHEPQHRLSPRSLRKSHELNAASPHSNLGAKRTPAAAIGSKERRAGICGRSLRMLSRDAKPR